MYLYKSSDKLFKESNERILFVCNSGNINIIYKPFPLSNNRF